MLLQRDNHHPGINEDNPRNVEREVPITQKMELAYNSFQLLRGLWKNTVSILIHHIFRKMRT